MSPFDFHKRHEFQGWGARREWPPLNPQPDDPNTYTYVSEAHVTEIVNDCPEPPISTTGIRPPDPLVIWSMGFEVVFSEARFNNAGSLVGTAWIANEARWLPFFVTENITARKMMTYNGNTVAGNVDVGIYTYAGTKLVSSGSTAMSGANVLQEFDIADTALTAGSRYYLAFSSDSSTAEYVAATSAGTPTETLSLAALRQATAFPLPATTASAAVWNNETPVAIPVVGFSRRTLVT